MRQMPASMGKPKFRRHLWPFSVLEKRTSRSSWTPDHRHPSERPGGDTNWWSPTPCGSPGGRLRPFGAVVGGLPGYANVSHGCINLSPDNALWYFNQVGIGDPVVINW